LTKFWWGNLKERNYLEDLGVDGSILQVITCKQGVPRLCRFCVVTVKCTKHFVQWNLEFVCPHFGICFVSTLTTPGILKWLPDFWKICAPLHYSRKNTREMHEDNTKIA
jgi:hypothetical protein